MDEAAARMLRFWGLMLLWMHLQFVGLMLLWMRS